MDVAAFICVFRARLPPPIGSGASVPLWIGIMHCGFLFFIISCAQSRHSRPLNLRVCMQLTLMDDV